MKEVITMLHHRFEDGHTDPKVQAEIGTVDREFVGGPCNGRVHSLPCDQTTAFFFQVPVRMVHVVDGIMQIGEMEVMDAEYTLLGDGKMHWRNREAV